MPNFLKIFKKEGPKEVGYVRDYVTGNLVKATKDEVRRQFVERKLVIDLGYPKEVLGVDVDLEVDGKSLGKVDVVIFRSPDVRDPVSNAFAFVFVRSVDSTELKKLMDLSSAEYCLLHTQDSFTVLRKFPDSRLGEVCRFPAYGEGFESFECAVRKESLRPTVDLGTQIDDLYRYVAKAEGIKGGRLLDEFLKLLMLKLGDEVVAGDESLAWVSNNEFVELSRNGESSSFKSKMSALIAGIKGKLLDPEDVLNLKDRTVAEAFRRLHGISLLKCNDLSKYESLRTVAREYLNVERGEVLTPYPIADLMVRMLNPGKDDLIVDPACGSGRLIAWVVKYVRNRYGLSPEDVLKFVRNNMLCIDINPTAIKIAKAYMTLYSGDVGNAIVANSLSPFTVLEEVGLKASLPQHLIPGPNKYDIILTHPPFNIKQRVSRPEILSQYELGYKWNYDRKVSRWAKRSDLVREQLVEVLFIERCYQMLKMYGRMGIILPEEILASGALGYVRQWLIDNARVVAAVSIPPQALVPYGVKAGTFLLIIQKVPKEELEGLKAKEYRMFVANLEKVGYDAFGNPTYRKGKAGEIITDELGNPVIESDVQLISEKFEEFKKSEGLTFLDPR